MKDTDAAMFYKVFNSDIEIWFCIMNLTSIEL